MRARNQFRLATLLWFVAFAALVLGARSACKQLLTPSMRAVCTGQLSVIALGLQQYHDANGELPPAYLVDAQSNPTHSWRALWLRYRSYSEAYADFRRYDLSLPWNNQINKDVVSAASPLPFSCPQFFESQDSGLTNYVVVTGPETAFPGAASTSIMRFKDAPEDTILVIELAGVGVFCTEPRDVTLDTLCAVGDSTEKLFVVDAHGAGVIFADFKVFRIAKPIPLSWLRSLLTINGEEAITRSELVSKGYLE